MKRTYRPGDYLISCQRTGFTVYASDTRLEWNGLRVRKESWEARHPQDLIRVPKDDQAAPDPRPEPEYRFLETNEVQASDL